MQKYLYAKLVKNLYLLYLCGMRERITIFFLKSLARLPLGLLYCVADLIYGVLYYIIRYRRDVTVKNLTEAFPEKSRKEIKKIEKEYYHYLADQIAETVKLLHISDEELKRRVELTDIDKVNATLAEGRNAVVLMGHYGNWEWVQEITREFIPEAYMASIYRPLADKVWDDIYCMLRSRWGAHIIARDRVIRVLLDRKNFPWVCGFIADQRPSKKSDENWVEFLNHKTYFIYGPEDIGKKVNADFFYLEMLKKGRGKYEIVINRLSEEGFEKPYPIMRAFWHEFEKTIRKYPAYWLWSHKRWK